MNIYTGQASLKMTPESLYSGRAGAQSIAVVSWSYNKCVKQWFRVEGSCFSPPPTPTCPPYPQSNQLRFAAQASAVASTCFSQDLLPLPTLYNTGLAADRSLLSVCSIDPNYLLLPSQSPYVVDAANVPMGSTPPTASSQYIGVACNGKSDYDQQFTFRCPFVCPDNVDPQSLEITVVVDTPQCQLVDIVINGNSTGFSAPRPVNAKQFVLSGFVAGDNTIDFPVIHELPAQAIPPIGGVSVVIMLRFTAVLGCVGTGGSPNPGAICKFNYKANVRACDAEDVCRILKENGPIFPIKSISIPNDSFDVNCYVDVTPNLNDCIECCDFLIDENRQENIFGNSTLYEIYEYDGNASIVGTPASSASIVLIYNGEASVSGTPDSSQYVIYGPPPSEAIVFGSAESGTAGSYYSYDGIGSIVLIGESTAPVASYWIYDGIGNIVASPSSGVTGLGIYSGSAFVGVSVVSANVSVYTGLARIGAAAKTSGGVTNVLYTGLARAVPTAASLFGSSFLEYFGLAKVVPSASSQVQWQYTGNAGVRLTPSSSLYAFFNYSGAGSVSGTGATTVAQAPVWIWDGLTFASPIPDSEFSSSDLGVFFAEGDVDNEILNEMVILQATPVDPIVVDFPNLNLIGCCSSIAQSLQLRHNLGSIPKFANFLLRNGLTVPGQLIRGRSETFIPLPYTERAGGWVANLHLEGLSTSGTGSEMWNITMTMTCSGGFWLLGLRVLRTIPGLSETLRLTTTYLQPQFCPVSTGFVGFSYAVDTKTETSAPTANLVVFHDEAGWTLLSPNSLNFIISTNNGPNVAITSISNLNSQLQAANALI